MPKPKAGAMQILVAANPLGIKAVYSNNMSLTLSGVDARLFFNEVLADPKGDLSAELRASVVMPLIQLKATVIAIQGAIDKHEAKLPKVG